jgi:hypothetical protein
MNALLNIFILFLVRIVIPFTLLLLIGEKVHNQHSANSPIF